MGLNNIAGNIWKKNLEKAQGVINNLTVENVNKWWKANIVQSSDELANVYIDTQLKRNTILNDYNLDIALENLNIKSVDDIFNQSANKSDEYRTAFNKFKSSIDAGDIDEARTTATSISERFQDGKYLELLQEAESSYNDTNVYFNFLREKSDMARRDYMVDFKFKIPKNNILNEKQEEWIADKAYRLQGKKQYFNKPDDPKVNQARIGVAAGTYMGGAMVVRAIHGGGPIHNEYGERDIVGIPFI